MSARLQVGVLAAAAARLQDRFTRAAVDSRSATGRSPTSSSRSVIDDRRVPRAGVLGAGRGARAVDVQQQSLDLALELERTNRARVDVGQSPPLDLVAARAEVAQRRENLIVSRTLARQAEDRSADVDRRSEARGFLERPPRTGRSRPAGRPPRRMSMPPSDARWPSAPTWSARVRKSRSTRPAIALAKSETKPDLRLEANYLTEGAGGTRILRSGGFPGPSSDPKPRPTATSSGRC